MKRCRKFISLLMSIVVILSCTTSAFAVNIANAFAKDSDDSIDSYIKAFKWNEDLFDKIRWTYDDEDDEDVLWFKRRAGYQTDFWDDNIETTKKYLGITDGTHGFGNGNNIVAVAESQYGAEDSYETPLGSNNVKYNTWIYGRVVSGSGVPWCCAFVSWCANECGYIDSGLFTKTASCATQYHYLVDDMGFESIRIENTSTLGDGDYTPVPGDIMFFSVDYGASWTAESFEHIGIIVEVNDDGWWTVEGNSSNKVDRLWYDKSKFNSQLRVRHGLLVHVEYPASAGGHGEEDIFNYLTGVLGLNTAVACGILGMAKNETGGTFEHDLIEEVGIWSGRLITYGSTDGDYYWSIGGGYGLFQWTNYPNARSKGNDTAYLQTDTFTYQDGHRRTNLVNWCNINGYDFTSLEGQLSYLWYELSTQAYFRSLYNTLMSVPDTLSGAYQAGFKFGKVFGGGGTFISADDYGALIGGYAQGFYGKYS